MAQPVARFLRQQCGHQIVPRLPTAIGNDGLEVGERLLFGPLDAAYLVTTEHRIDAEGQGMGPFLEPIHVAWADADDGDRQRVAEGGDQIELVLAGYGVQQSVGDLLDARAEPCHGSWP